MSRPLETIMNDPGMRLVQGLDQRVYGLERYIRVVGNGIADFAGDWQSINSGNAELVEPQNLAMAALLAQQQNETLAVDQ